MKNIIKLLIILFFCGFNSAYAANLAVITSPPTLLNLAGLVVAVICVIGSFKVLTLVRGGSFSRSWQFLMGGFITFVLGQLVMMLNTFEIISVPSFLFPAFLVLAAGLFLYGIWETKRVLS